MAASNLRCRGFSRTDIKFGASIIEVGTVLRRGRGIVSAFAVQRVYVQHHVVSRYNCVSRRTESRAIPGGSLIIINIAVDNGTSTSYNIAMMCMHRREMPSFYAVCSRGLFARAVVIDIVTSM